MGKVRWHHIYKDDKLVIEEFHKIIVHKFELSAGMEDIHPYRTWQQSELGKFITEHTVSELEYDRYMEPALCVYRCIVIAELEKKKLSEYYLRFGKPSS